MNNMEKERAQLEQNGETVLGLIRYQQTVSELQTGRRILRAERGT